MSKEKYEVTILHRTLSPIGTFEGKEIIRIKNNETGKVETGRGHTREQAYDNARSKQIESGKKR